LAVIGRYFAHAIVLVVVLTVSGYASITKELPAGTKLRLGVVNAQGLALGQGGTTGDVALGRSGTIIKPVAIPTSAPVQHTPTLYTVREGEDVTAIATKFNLNPDQIRWSNPLQLTKSDRIKAGDQLMIPPVPGVVVLARDGDTVQGLASAYKVDVQSVVDFNYLRDPEHLASGQTLVLPNGKGPQLFPRRVSYDPPALGTFANGKFAYGYCTWYVASRRYVPWTGDAWQWFSGAKAMGFPTGNTPQPGAIMVTWESFVGHVAFVEQVNADGSFVVSEMNYKGWNVISTRNLSGPSAVPLIGFIY
jgi:LysM repeat protein